MQEVLLLQDLDGVVVRLTPDVVLSFVKAVVESDDTEVAALQQLNHLVGEIEALSGLDRLLKLRYDVTLGDE